MIECAICIETTLLVEVCSIHCTRSTRCLFFNRDYGAKLKIYKVDVFFSSCNYIILVFGWLVVNSINNSNNSIHCKIVEKFTAAFQCLKSIWISIRNLKIFIIYQLRVLLRKYCKNLISKFFTSLFLL